MLRQGQPRKGLALVVDDQPSIRKMVCRALAGLDILTTEASDGLEAIELASRTHFDLVILDIEMPRMNGYDACRGLRRLPGGRYLPILIITSSDDTATIEESYNAGATDFISKPINWMLFTHHLRFIIQSTKAVRTLQESQRRLAETQLLAHIANWERYPDSDDLYCSVELFRILGLPYGDSSLPLRTFLRHLMPQHRKSVSLMLDEALKNGKELESDLQITREDGETRYILLKGLPHYDAHGTIDYVSGTLQDITERKFAEDQIRHLAYYDPLTQLPNRQLFREQALMTLKRAARNNTHAALLYLDLDNFKHVNDTMGHGAGDCFLKDLSRRILSALRETDLIAAPPTDNGLENVAWVARVGGDEFIMMAGDLESPQASATIAQRILDKVEQPLIVEGQEFFPSGSIGIAVYPDDGDDVDTLMKHADTAMYHVKEQGRNGFAFYQDSMNQAAMRKLQLESRLRRAIENDELILHYQPQIDAQNGELIAVEALVRWICPKRGLVPPGDFIPLAEETGLIVPIGSWVMRQACRQIHQWNEAGYTPIPIGINISSRQFREKDFVKTVEQILGEEAVAPAMIEIELTESLIMSDAEESIIKLKQLKQMGMKVSVDDFGTGYSSLAYLKKLPLDVLKIDRQFVMDLPDDENDAAIVSAIISLAQSLNLTTIAEGVETREQLAFLSRQGCTLIQGYFISKPLPANELFEFFDVIGHQKAAELPQVTCARAKVSAQAT